MTRKKTRAENNANHKPPEAENSENVTSTAHEQQADDSETEIANAAEVVDESPGEEVDDPLVTLRNEVEKNLEGWQRTLAEFQNYRKRIEREQKDLRHKSTLETLTEILPIIDDFERALDNVPEDLQDNPWIDGVTLIQGKFKKLLENHEVSVLDPVGEPFDPNIHQAIGMDDSDEYESGHVIETLQKGYISGDILLRPAIVRVAN